MEKLTLRDIDVRGRRVLVRVDFNVNRENGEILDDFRIRQSLPTIKYLRKQGAKIVLCSHLGRPEKETHDDRMWVVAQRLCELLKMSVTIAPDCVGREVERTVTGLAKGGILLLENLRFHPGEIANDRRFARHLARLAEIYVSDAFATVHREHASVAGAPKFMHVAVAGLLVETEIKRLTPLVRNPKHPYGAIFGGGKISDKLELISEFVQRADVLVLGGAMANTFLKAKGLEVGRSRVENEMTGAALRILAEAKANNKRLLLPVDVVVAQGPDDDAGAKEVDVADVGPDQWILDIGPRSVELFANELARCKMIIWNGPMGKFEVPRFAKGTKALAEAVGKIPAYRVAGGGDTSALHRIHGLMKNFDWVSTGGGAFLEFLIRPNLPGLAALTDRTPVRSSQRRTSRRRARTSPTSSRGRSRMLRISPETRARVAESSRAIGVARRRAGSDQAPSSF